MPGAPLITASRLFSQADGQHLGVVGIDVTMDSIVALLDTEEWGDVYTFLTTDDLSTVVHPLLRDADGLDTALFPNIAFLEQTLTPAGVRWTDCHACIPDLCVYGGNAPG